MRHDRSTPGVPGTDAARRAGSPTGGRTRYARIMIVDGNPGSLKRTSDALAQHGYLVAQAFDATQAQRILEHTIPNLILADSGLPGVDRLALNRDLATDDPLKHVPIIALSAGDPDGGGSRTAGYDGWMAAPADARELAMQVAAFLVRGASRRS